jgi:uncharacterized LabA/DUF88 family protein
MPNRDENLVAVFIDYENLLLSYREQVDKYADLDWAKILDLATKKGRLVIKRAYADWSIFGDKQKELLGYGFELINTPSRGGKNAADIKIVIDTLSLLRDQVREITHFLLVSGDGDFIDLVHHLHTHGKSVTGMGVSGATSNYLTQVCDEYVFYDVLAKSPSVVLDPATEARVRPVSFDVREARRILRQALQKIETPWVDASDLKNAMLRIDSTFNERNYNFDKFKDFLAAQSDLVVTKNKEPLGLLVQELTENNAAPDNENPERQLDRYLQFLAREKIRMRSTEHRKAIIINMFGVIQKNSKISYTEVIKILANVIENKAPYISYSFINEAAHQLFRSQCFYFDDDDNYPPGTKLWDRSVSLKEGIESANDLLTWCDRELLKKILHWLEPEEKINPEVAVRLLYGQEGMPYKMDHIEKLIEEIQNR